MQPTTFLYLVFGSNTNNHVMTNFSILSLKKQAPANCRFVVYTDKPDHYKFLSSFVETRKLDEKTLADWQGKQSFVWRIKLMAMLDSAEKDTGHLVYMDSDTFALGKLSSMIERLDEGNCLMYSKEGTLAEIKVPSRRLIWKQTKDRIFGDMTVNDTSTIWNAGVVGINEFFRLELITRALASTDQMCEQEIERIHIEQLSLSQALSATRKLESADPWIVHYWNEKEDLTRNIHLFLSNVLLRQHSIEKAMALIDVNHWRDFLTKTEKRKFQRWFNEI
jgi:hypothetical protein